MPDQSSPTPVLSDHKRIGKRFIPPLLQLGDFHDVPWLERVLPELLWIALLIRGHGLKRSASLLVTLARTALKTYAATPKPWFAPASSFQLLGETRQHELRKALEQSRFLSEFEEPLQPLLQLYPQCPLACIFARNGTTDSKESDIRSIKQVVAELVDKRSSLATFTQANAVYVAFTTDILKVKEGLTLARFPEIESYPETEISQKIAGGVRCAILSLMGIKNEGTTWSTYFWNRGIELEPCNFG